MDSINCSMHAIKSSNQEITQTYTVLDNKRFRCMSRDLMMLLVEKLGGSALKVYLSLYDRAEFIRHQKKVVLPIYISYAALAKSIGKSVATIGRALNELKTKGFIKVFEQGKSEDVYLPTKILVGLPKNIASKIMSSIPDRKEKNKSQYESGFEADCASEDYPELSLENDELIKRYNNSIEQLKNEGISAPKATARALKSFTEQEQEKINSHNLKPNENFISSASSKVIDGKNKSEQHKDNNRKDILLTKGSCSQDLKSNSEKTPHYFVKRKNFSTEEFSALEKKIRYLKKSNLILGDAKYKSISDVLSEIRFHIYHSPLSFKHSLNACCKLLTSGRWQKPKRMVFFESVAREKKAKIEKKKEFEDFRANWGNSILGEAFA